jgi:hypothetical protein
MDLFIEAGKSYRTRDGKKALILITGLKNENFPVAGVVEDGGGKETVETWGETGNTFLIGPHGLDLVAEWVEPRTQDVWLNVYATKTELVTSYSFNNRETADNADDCQARNHRVARIKVTLREGQWDE